LPVHVSDLLPRWRELISQLSIPGELAQLEFAIGEGKTPGSLTTAFVLRHLEPLSSDDQQKLINFAQIQNIDMWLQPAGLDSAYPLHPAESHLCYRLPEFDIEMPFKPTDFTQVNHQVNRVLVSKAIQLLAPQSSDRVLDLFCGIGNFTLPLARRAAEVFGIEGSDELTKRAKENAIHNQLGERVNFACSNLFEVTPSVVKSWGKADKWLIDPPRDGAMALANSLALMANSGNSEEKSYLPKRIVYVSCNPATLARDVGILVGQAGYRLKAAGVINMFPHTSHVESIAVFER
jgi:23S rRNA (uracil1939-C5)-methyltransferase